MARLALPRARVAQEMKIASFPAKSILKVATNDTWPRSCSTFPSASASASPSRAASTPAPPCTGCAARAPIPYAYTANLGQPDEPDYDDIPRKALAVRRREGAPDRLPHPARGRRHRRAAVRRLPHLHRRRHLLQHHAARPRRHRHDAGRGDEGRRRRHLGRRQHVQGQRHRALLPLRPARQSDPAHLQAVARPGVHRRARRPQGDVRVHGRRPASPTRCRAEKAYSTDSNMLGATHEAKDLEQLDERHHHRPADHGRGVLARRRRGQARDGHGALRRRPAGRAERRRATRTPSR